MPDRYGDDDHQEQPTRLDRRETNQMLAGAATASCPLCDDDGYRGARVCDHIDHTAAAKRGMDMIRETMGWTKP